MSQTDNNKAFHRILVAMDASPHSKMVLEVAAEIATRLQAELIGIYIEDINLLRVAEFPFTCEIGYFSAKLMQFNSPDLERQWRACARWVHQAMQMTARHTDLHWKFQTVRGFITGELLTAAEETDLIVVGHSGWSGRRVIGSTTQSLVKQATHQALILRRRLRPESKMIIVYDGSELGKKTLLAARSLGVPDCPTTILILADDYEQAQHLNTQAQVAFQSADFPTNYRWLPEADAAAILQISRLEDFDLLVIPAESQSISFEALLAILNGCDCSILLVR